MTRRQRTQRNPVPPIFMPTASPIRIEKKAGVAWREARSRAGQNFH
jgi:hypothetical protein